MERRWCTSKTKPGCSKKIQKIKTLELTYDSRKFYKIIKNFLWRNWMKTFTEKPQKRKRWNIKKKDITQSTHAVYFLNNSSWRLIHQFSPLDQKWRWWTVVSLNSLVGFTTVGNMLHQMEEINWEIVCWYPRNEVYNKGEWHSQDEEERASHNASCAVSLWKQPDWNRRAVNSIVH